MDTEGVYFGSNLRNIKCGWPLIQIIYISDDLVPNVMKASVSPLPCCYKDIIDPAAGTWVSLNLNTFCQEPDQNQLESSTTSILPSDAEPDVSTSFRSAQLLCDKIPSPSAELNITASEIGTSWYVWRQRLRESNLLNMSLSREGLVEDPEDDFGFDLLRLVRRFLDWLAEISYDGTLTTSLPMTTSVTLPPLNYTMTDLEEQPVATSSGNRTIAFLSFTLTVRFRTLVLASLVAILHWTKIVIVNNWLLWYSCARVFKLKSLNLAIVCGMRFPQGYVAKLSLTKS